ncbi:hypothetical protein B9T23_11145 [Acinetobacter terrae]|nr:hypothetical protein B9T23_11145 [Acinetobacter terrae]
MKKRFSCNEHSFLYFLFTVLFISIIMTNILHDEVIDTLLTIFNCFLIIKILSMLSTKLLKAVMGICNP